MRHNAGMSDVLDANPGAVADREGPPEPESGPPLPLWRRRWVRPIAGVVSLAVVGAGVWWRREVTADPKLDFPYFSRVNRIEDDATGVHDGIERKENLLGTEYAMSFVPGQRVFVYSGIHNGGRHAIRIEAAPAAGFYYFGFDRMEVSPDRDAGIGEVTNFEPFKPFTLEPDEARAVRLNFRMADCHADPRGGTTSIGSLGLRYRILGISRSVDIPFTKSVLAAVVTGFCDRPILDRSIARP
jgi:hypothetical protein